MFACTECGIILGPDETAVMVLLDKKYGHVTCLREEITVEELEEEGEGYNVAR